MACTCARSGGETQDKMGRLLVLCYKIIVLTIAYPCPLCKHTIVISFCVKSAPYTCYVHVRKFSPFLRDEMFLPMKISRITVIYKCVHDQQRMWFQEF